MPELPEVETTRRGIAPHCEGKAVARLTIRDSRLRWPVPDDLPELLAGQTLRQADRRAKYLLLRFDHGTVLVHLGMSGSLRVITDGSSPLKHDHIELLFNDGTLLRFNDPRRFGCWLWSTEPDRHILLANLGPEPLSGEFSGAYLHRKAQGRKTPVKSFLMDNRIVVGVGNIYANEALFKTGIHPNRAAGRVSAGRYHQLCEAVKETLSGAILMGGTTLRDFVNSDGKPGYFAQSLQAYGRGGLPCFNCQRPLKEIRMNQRTTVYCSHCQR
ncbi:DNA-(apurinic or apyrimidinic site) lyase [Marinobacter daqiaonensis]|uniref:Formamidopyrimidine-DNA glycosylase n=1 Tax=Marinobacter daqiaonensis TaxID=650891 RepID=A0A1I6I884_9GAMM|nr:bifunctional DNA-formamidopyrimidine glycosylase/DNA-(apurinic or apyrimidinic site) lyase [Marinobacter daqiaonensis]SFR62955.1 DNA-(apurinic or apyrimidinic site) lyase [Marinobacter daqiaonensis]